MTMRAYVNYRSDESLEVKLPYGVVGPVPFASIFELFRLGIITPHTNVFCDGMKKKAPVQEIGGLLSLLAPSAQHSRPSSRQGSSSEPVSASHKKEASSQDPRRKSPDPGAGEHTLPAGTGLSRCRWLFQVKNDAQCGPVPFEELETMWVDGRLPPGTAVWAEGLKSLGAITIEQGEDEESSPLSRASRLPPSGCAPLAGPDTAMLPLPTASAPGPGGGADCRIQQWLQQAHARSDTASHEGLEDTSGSHQRLLKVMRERDEAKELALVLKAMLMEAKATGEQASVSTAHMDAAHGTGTLVQRPLRPTGVNEAQLGEMARLGEELVVDALDSAAVELCERDAGDRQLEHITAQDAPSTSFWTATPKEASRSLVEGASHDSEGGSPDTERPADPPAGDMWGAVRASQSAVPRQRKVATDQASAATSETAGSERAAERPSNGVGAGH
eukprot:gene16136-19141_t